MRQLRFRLAAHMEKRVRYNRTGKGIPANEQVRREFAGVLRQALAKAKLEKVEVELRERNGEELEKPLTQDELSVRCTALVKGNYGFSKFVISRWMNGHRLPSLTNMSVLCRALNIQVKDLFPSINPKDKKAVLTSRQVEKVIGYPKYSRDGIGRVRNYKGRKAK